MTPTDKSLWCGSTAVPSDRNPARVGPKESARGAVEVGGGGGRNKFRYYEECISAGDPLLALGEFSRGRFGATAEEQEDENDDELELDAAGALSTTALESDALDVSTDEDDLGARLDKAWDDQSIVDRFTEQVQHTSSAWIAKGSGAKPFILSTTLQAIDVAQSEMGSQAALALAWGALLVAAFLLWARFG